MKRKILAALITIVIMALIRTEINNAVIEAVCSEIRRYRRKKQRIFEKYNLKRWAEVDFNELQHGKYIEIA